ncbi:hypothetical protein AMIS_79850 [Actinoplanes missouriensis 431]|uniref:Uncharacterized protein n=1 Tax=Actinoplanes missouriensis (strain ATCC 14538 / DSM 43046 / CBS 188.64 / JCM 3121 / NBRC 102363 / NCIMB 12654 / NRRL B-3342 / UNCC 431) TaxID=512565 RepID=I0HJL8_ACTM4|nr:hypothetical protein AMIS_79850 [Actinoplanes missouriensis 431]
MHGSAAIDLAWLAAGHIDTVVMLANKPWDTSGWRRHRPRSGRAGGRPDLLIRRQRRNQKNSGHRTELGISVIFR